MKPIIENSLYFFIGLLFLVWPMDRLIAVRNIDIGIIFLLSIGIFFRYKRLIKFDKYFKYLLVGLIFFLMWVLIISCFSSFKTYCLHEIKNQLLFPILLIISAFFLVNSKINYKSLFFIAFTMMFIFVLYHALYSFHYYVYHHHLPLRSFGLTFGLDELNFMMPFLLTFFLVEFVFRILKLKPLLPISTSLLILLFLITILSLITQAKRNGIVSIAFMAISIIIIIAYSNKKINKKIIFLSIFSLIFIGVMGYISYKDDSRWKSFTQVAKLVLIQNDMSRLHGKHIGESNYERLFYIKEGVKLIYDNPLGYGYGREIFGKAISHKYNVNVHTHAHSGIIDLGVGTGIIGLMLWTFMIFIIIYIGFKNFFIYKNYYGLFAAVISTSFYFRMFLDSVNRDHMLQQFVFLVSLSIFAMQKELNAKNNLSSS
jgi:O-antigen ligase